MFCEAVKTSDECHAHILPQNEMESIKLIRHENKIYKFIIKDSPELKKSIEQYGEIKVQQKIEDIIIYLIKMKEEHPVEIQLSTSLFWMEIYIYPWHLSTRICFRSLVEEQVYYLGKQQYMVTIVKEKISTLGQ